MRKREIKAMLKKQHKQSLDTVDILDLTIDMSYAFSSLFEFRNYLISIRNLELQYSKEIEKKMPNNL